MQGGFTGIEEWAGPWSVDYDRTSVLVRDQPTGSPFLLQQQEIYFLKSKDTVHLHSKSK